MSPAQRPATRYTSTMSKPCISKSGLTSVILHCWVPTAFSLLPWRACGVHVAGVALSVRASATPGDQGLTSRPFHRLVCRFGLSLCTFYITTLHSLRSSESHWFELPDNAPVQSTSLRDPPLLSAVLCKTFFPSNFETLNSTSSMNQRGQMSFLVTRPSRTTGHTKFSRQLK